MLIFFWCLHQDQDRDQDLESPSKHIKRYFPVRLCVLVISVLVILLGLLLGSIYTYRHFHPSQVCIRAAAYLTICFVNHPSGVWSSFLLMFFFLIHLSSGMMTCPVG